MALQYCPAVANATLYGRILHEDYCPRGHDVDERNGYRSDIDCYPADGHDDERVRDDRQRHPVVRGYAACRPKFEWLDDDRKRHDHTAIG